ncbi:hypothetical protein KBTX_03223 [wastewater metagenome]|uniref:RES domain-containing protein n=2 Tax=unclassified sequences TaxID=12908 RepID=A0A5B8RH68_9ZZZZ|nr:MULTISPECIES: RES domain-containing protein [Arhodomonas]MCS4504797.1 RES domain-containing protein [Arhodomonas aquaeolei]QEA06882.1 hypothetical protein KBTEX_03223 [uncultured organism]
MSVQRLDRTLSAYRIGDPDGDYPIYDATGSRRYPGRWNTATTPVIYACEHYSTAMLEKLVHAGGLMPPNQHFIEITLPHGLSYEMVTKDALPGWDTPEPSVSAGFGARWAAERRSAVLLVPSFVARVEHNVVINPDHEEFERIGHGLPTPVWWDDRLFAE